VYTTQKHSSIDIISCFFLAPLSFSYAPVTFEFLRRKTSTIANNDAPRAASLMWSLRERIAVALHTAHAKVILALVSKQRDASADGTIGSVVGDRTTLNLAGDATPVV